MSVLKICLFALFLLGALVQGNDKVVVCYFDTSAVYRPGDKNFDVANVNTELCTHLVYSSVIISKEGIVKSLDRYLDMKDHATGFGLGLIEKFNALKKGNGKLKTLLSVGKWIEGYSKYANMTASAELRKNFITSAVDMVTSHGFDGLDIHWDHPGERDTSHSHKDDIDNFTQFLKELREEFDKHGLLITVAVTPLKKSASHSYNIALMAKYVDLVMVKAYNMHGLLDVVTRHNAPLYKGEGDEHKQDRDIYTVEDSLKYWLDHGCPTSKLVLGLSSQGRSFNLTTNDTKVGAPSHGFGWLSPNVPYFELCVLLKNGSWEMKYDTQAEAPYAFQGSNWITYDNPQSITKKVEYAEQLGLAGVMVWTIDNDDFRGICGQDYPLLRAVNEVLHRNDTTPEPVTQDPITSPATPSKVSVSTEGTNSPIPKKET